MPIYEYRCSACSERYEILVSSAGRSKPPCPRCGAASVERLLSTFAVGKSAANVPDVGPCGSSDCACRSPGID